MGKYCVILIYTAVQGWKRKSAKTGNNIYSIELNCTGCMMFAAVVKEQTAVIAELNTKLQSVEEDLEAANKRECIYIYTIYLSRAYRTKRQEGMQLSIP